MRVVSVLAVTIFATGCGEDRDSAPTQRASRLLPVTKAPASTAVTVAGSVIDRDTREVVGDVEVVLRGDHGDVATRTKTDGTFSVLVPRGSYRAFVRDARVISTGLQGRLHVRATARRELAGVADERLMPVIEIGSDTNGVELTVTVGALISGVVRAPNGDPVEDAVIHALAEEPTSGGVQPTIGPATASRAAPRPALGTDTVISDGRGQFILRVPAGRYELVAEHPQYAGVSGRPEVELDAGRRLDTTLTLQRGCVISGKVITSAGTRAPDGAIETMSESGDFVPAERIRPDGTFRFATMDEHVVDIRAWPWRTSPSGLETISCSDGKQVRDIVLRTGNALPDLGGTLVDAAGDPVPLAYFDVTPLDRGQSGQQERSDVRGRWNVYDLPAGRYQITAYAPGRGVLSTMVVAPKRDQVLQLEGTGRLWGTTTHLVDGSFELVMHHCGPASNPIEIADDARLVIVRGGRFSVDRVPACTLTFSARWRDRVISQAVVIDPGLTSSVELDLGTPRDKTVHGTVRDAAGNAVPNARITSIVDNKEVATIRADGTGSFTLSTRSGAQLVAASGTQVGGASVGRANVLRERVDVVLGLGVD